MKLTCAKCGEIKELCESFTSNGIKQPRICKDCLIKTLETGDESINNNYWFRQLVEADILKNLNKPTN